MVYKKYIKKKGKLYGPYYYKNVRDKNGKVKNIFLGKNYKKLKKKVALRKVKIKKVAPRVSKPKFKLSFFNRFNVYLIILIVCLGALGLSFVGHDKIVGAPMGGLPEFNGEVPTDTDIYEDQLYECDVNATDPEGGVITFTDDTDLFDIDPDTGMISFTPLVDDAGVYTGLNSIAILAKDDEVPAQGRTYLWEVTIHEVNDDPVFVDLETDFTITAYEPFEYDVNATDEETSPVLPEIGLTYVADDLWSGIDPLTGEISFTPENSDAGYHLINIAVSDGEGGSASEQIEIQVIENFAPYFIHSLENQNAKAQVEFTYDILAEDPDGGAVDFIIDESDLGIFDIETIDNQNGTYTGKIEFTPTIDQIPGPYLFRVNISDEVGLNNSGDFYVTIFENMGPVIDYIEPLELEFSAYENETLYLNQTPIDPDDNLLYYYWYENNITIGNSQNMSFNVSFDISNNTLNNTVNVSFVVADEVGLKVDGEWNITVYNLNRHPYLENHIPNVTFYKNSIGSLDSLDNYFTDLDNDFLNYSGIHLDTENIGIEIDEKTHEVKFRPTSDWFGIDAIMFYGFDEGELNASSNNITLEVLDQESPPPPPPPPQPSSSPLVLKGGSSNRRVAALTVVVAPLVVLPPFDTITTNIVLINTGDYKLNDIYLSTISDDKDLILDLGNTYWNGLNIDERVDADLTISSLNLIDKKYEIVIVANVTNPRLSETDIIYLTPLPLNVTKIEKEILFAKDLFEQNTECLELKELITQAEEKQALGESGQATLIIENAVESCKGMIRDSRINVERPYAMPSYYWPVTLALLILLLVTVAIVVRLFKGRKKKIEEKQK